MRMKSIWMACVAILLTLVPLKAVNAASEAAAEAETMGTFVTVLAIFSFATLALMMFYCVRDNG
ncbi:hypothetical protein ACI2JA_02295 [Alkalihalobacillus sp. NPDC078783]